MVITDVTRDVRMRRLGISSQLSYRSRELSEEDDAAVRGITEELRLRLSTDARSLT